MLARTRSHLTFANVVSLIALFVALGGTGYAAITLPKNSVGPKQIKKNAVRASDVRAGAVRSAEVRNGTLADIDVLDGGLTGADIGNNTIALADLGGNSVDGAKVADGSLGTDDIADASVGGIDVAEGALTGGDVADGSLGSGDVAAGTFLGAKVTVQFEQAAADLANGAEMSLDVHCPEGQTAIGGGARGDLTDSEKTTIGSSRPIISTTSSGAPGDDGTFTGWRTTVQNEDNGAGIRPEVWVICASL